jgi:4-hydroxy-2-oxoglutarate aldolase
MLLEGLLPPLTSCFHPDGRPYWGKLEQNIERYSRTPLTGFTILGSTGEAIMLSDEESRETLRVARDAAAPEKVLLAGVGRESVKETLRFAEYAAELSYDAVLVRTPHFYRPLMRHREMLTYYQTVADRSPLPVLLYSVPPFTAYDLPLLVIAELANHPNIIGMKDSSGKVERIAQIVDATRDAKKRTVAVTNVFAPVTARMLADAQPGRSEAEGLVAAAQLGSGATAVAAKPPRTALPTRTREVGFQVLTAAAQTLYACLEAGAVGAVVAMGDFAPQAVHEIYTAWKDKDEVLAAEKQKRVHRAGQELCSAMGIPGIKYAMDLNGYFGGLPRLPLLPLTADEQKTVEELLTDIRN